MTVRLFAILFILSICIPDVVGNTVISNSVSNAFGAVGYSISYSDTAGSLTYAPAESITSYNNLIYIAITGCSIQGADWIKGVLSENTAHGDIAYVGADISGPGASVANYDLYGYLTPNLAWAGQYADSITGTSITLDAHSNNDKNPYNGNISYAMAESKLSLTGANPAVYTVSNWWQDSMAGGSYYIPGAYPNAWAMSSIYKGSTYKGSTAAVDSDGYLMDIATKSSYYDQGVSTRDLWSDAYQVPNSGRINSQSMGYADLGMSYTNIDISFPERNGFAYYL